MNPDRPKDADRFTAYWGRCFVCDTPSYLHHSDDLCTQPHKDGEMVKGGDVGCHFLAETRSAA